MLTDLSYLISKSRVEMKKVVRIVKKGDDDSNIRYWVVLTPKKRLQNLEEIRQE